ncbi:alpha/beta hydrolase [Chitinophaga sp. sic0106]|uniref:alpha/beta hydrolase n=1 Tax=Chitinophaga sp. sic0106 TaxID=2854785 RepID=UPI001C44A417|nr:alpha/beta hydrolase [Chitinophaga sp. sic0106]MBV7530086.1 alpha/beta hydrolase [Chitinophaga sp. sic0106]
MKKVFLLCIMMSAGVNMMAQQVKNIPLWPGNVPGETVKSPMKTSADNSGNVIRISEVTDPFISVYPAPAGSTKDAAVIVCPGGGYSILALDLEGTEIAKWFNSLGYTAFVLHYRVPQKQLGALQDVQRAIRIVRSKAADYHINPEKIGVLGFSAGGSLSARASTLYDVQQYTPVDAADQLSAKPAFTLLIYPAYLDKGTDRKLTPELKVNAATPPTFLFATADDPYGNSALVMAGAMRDAKAPVELHFYNKGGHGYGLRPGNPAAAAWPGLAQAWLKQFDKKD